MVAKSLDLYALCFGILIGVAAPAGAEGITDWAQCAAEHGRCRFHGTVAVRYGANGSYVTKNFAGGVECNNDVFGDPIPGVGKICEITRSAIEAPVLTMAPAALSASPKSGLTASGVPLPAGWTLKQSDYFGSGAGRTVTGFAQLHTKYLEGQYYNRDAAGKVRIPNVVINGEQQTYGHFENVIAFASDHITIQARGHADNSISSGELVSVFTSRSFCVEARYKIPNAPHAWPAFWQYGATDQSDKSELDFEQPISPNQGVRDVTMHNHPAEGTDLQIKSSSFTTKYMNYNSENFDASHSAHTYTSCYDDATARVSRHIDGALIYSAGFKWNQSLGGTGHGPDATSILNLAVGGGWPGYVSQPATFSADLDIYSVDYYAP